MMATSVVLVNKNEVDQKIILQQMHDFCLQRVDSWLQNESTSDSLHCPAVWDGIYCWPNVPAGGLYSVPCPSYIYGFNNKENASRYCNPDGTWKVYEHINTTWTNYTQCYYVHHHANTVLNETLLEPHMGNINLISKIGYSLSLSTLVVAFLILAFVRKLRCPRNNLHMQLFMSFMMRSVMFLLKEALFVEGIGLHPNITFSNDIHEIEKSIANVDCKVFTSFWHYFLMANYCWILMEGLYLHNLVFLAMFTDTSSILRYLIMGWGLPVIFIIPWVIVRATLDDTLCWTTNESPYFWIIRGPITLTILINFFFFINITRVLFRKMFGTQSSQRRNYRYRKWFKSTLVLVPLFGVHYTIFLVMSLIAEVNREVEVVWLYIDQLFSSSQGSFVALLYCFLNGEVQTELKKLLQTRWMPENLRSHHSLLSHSLTSYVSRGRSSVQSLHSTSLPEKKDLLRSIAPIMTDNWKVQDNVTSRLPNKETTFCLKTQHSKSSDYVMIELASQQHNSKNGPVTLRKSVSDLMPDENDRLLVCKEDDKEKESSL